MVIFTGIGLLFVGLLCSLVVNYMADVLPYTRSLSKPFCHQCHAPQNWCEYIGLRRCRNCHSLKKSRYWIVLAFYIFAVFYFYYFPSSRLNLETGLLLLTFFGTVAVIDIEHRVVLDQVILAGVVIGTAYGVWLHGVLLTILGGISGFGVMLLLYYTGILYSRWLSHRNEQQEDEKVALGFGDVNLSGVLGLILGFPGIFAGLLLAIIMGGVVSLFYIVSLLARHRWQPFSVIPYTPFLLLGAGLLLYLR